MQHDEEHLADAPGFESVNPDAEPGMNLISVDFDLVMVNRTNERLYGKPMVALLGNKCYQEFEKRDRPCPHCPGRLALETGEAHETETTGLRDDGTRFAARIRAHPVIGPDNRPTGFIEIVEDITEQKRSEALASIDARLQSSLMGVQHVRGALRETLGAALQIEGVDCGAAFLFAGEGTGPDLVAHRNLSSPCLELFARIAVAQGDAQGEENSLAGGDDAAPRAVVTIPITHRGSAIAGLVVGSTVYPHIPPSLRAGLLALGATTGTAISRMLAERSRGDAIADLEAVIAASPLATWAVDGRGRITTWNRAAEKMFGWKAAEMRGNLPPWETTLSAAAGAGCTTVLHDKDGRPAEVRLSTAPFRDVVGNDSALIFIAEDLTAQRRILELEGRVAELETRLATQPPKGEELPAGTPSLDRVRVLVVDGNEAWGAELAGVLCSLGCLPVRCGSAERTAAALAEAELAGDAFGVAVVALLGSGGASGLGQRAALRSLGLRAPVVMFSDVEVRGHEQHGIAAVIRRPYSEEAVRSALAEALRQRDHD